MGPEAPPHSPRDSHIHRHSRATPGSAQQQLSSLGQTPLPPFDCNLPATASAWTRPHEIPWTEICLTPSRGSGVSGGPRDEASHISASA